MMSLLGQLFSCEERYSVYLKSEPGAEACASPNIDPKYFSLKLWSLIIRKSELEIATACFKLLDLQSAFCFAGVIKSYF